MFVGVEFITINILLHTKSEQKVIGNYIRTPINFKNTLKVKTQFFNKKYTFTICVRRVLVVIVYFLLEKLTFNELLMVIGLQILPFFTYFIYGGWGVLYDYVFFPTALFRLKHFSL